MDGSTVVSNGYAYYTQRRPAPSKRRLLAGLTEQLRDPIPDRNMRPGSAGGPGRKTHPGIGDWRLAIGTAPRRILQARTALNPQSAIGDRQSKIGNRVGQSPSAKLWSGAGEVCQAASPVLLLLRSSLSIWPQRTHRTQRKAATVRRTREVLSELLDVVVAKLKAHGAKACRSNPELN